MTDIWITVLSFCFILLLLLLLLWKGGGEGGISAWVFLSFLRRRYFFISIQKEMLQIMIGLVSGTFED